MHHCTIAIFAKYMQVFIDNAVYGEMELGSRYYFFPLYPCGFCQEK